MKKCIVLLFEGYDGEFLFSLLEKHPSVITSNRSSQMIITNNAILLFAHPSNPETNGGKSDLKKHTNFLIAHRRTSICRSIVDLEIDEYLYLVLRDTDGAITQKQKSLINIDISTAFTRARCEGSLHIYYVHQMIENWYIAGLSSEHFTDSKYMEHRMRNILLEKTNAEKYGGAKNLIDDNISREHVGRKAKANLMGRILNIENAKRRSKTFKEYITFIEQYL